MCFHDQLQVMEKDIHVMAWNLANIEIFSKGLSLYITSIFILCSLKMFILIIYLIKNLKMTVKYICEILKNHSYIEENW